MADCPYFRSPRMQAVCFIGSAKLEGRPGKPGSGMMSYYRAAESICQNCTDYTPRGAA
jgi:hypothetical protein